jgi:hypothetical protein
MPVRMRLGAAAARLARSLMTASASLPGGALVPCGRRVTRDGHGEQAGQADRRRGRAPGDPRRELARAVEPTVAAYDGAV